MAFLGREYKYERSENFDEFLKAVGVPEEMAAGLKDFKPIAKLTKDGDTYTYTSTSNKGTRTTTFKSGVEFDDVIGEKFKVKSKFVVDGNTVTQTIISDLGVGTFIREYVGDEMIVTLKSTKFDGVAKRYYKAV